MPTKLSSVTHSAFRIVLNAELRHIMELYDGIIPRNSRSSLLFIQSHGAGVASFWFIQLWKVLLDAEVAKSRLVCYIFAIFGASTFVRHISKRSAR